MLLGPIAFAHDYEDTGNIKIGKDTP